MRSDAIQMYISYLTYFFHYILFLIMFSQQMELQELQDRHRKEIEAFRQLTAAGSGSAPSSQILTPACSGENKNTFYQRLSLVVANFV